jgi:hypothetical protein
MQEKMTLVKNVGNFVSGILLGETKETIIRMDEKIKGISSAITEIKVDIKDIKSSLRTHELDIVGLKAHAKYGGTNSA